MTLYLGKSFVIVYFHIKTLLLALLCFLLPSEAPGGSFNESFVSLLYFVHSMIRQREWLISLDITSNTHEDFGFSTGVSVTIVYIHFGHGLCFWPHSKVDIDGSNISLVQKYGNRSMQSS
jgi:hypothetical protein